MKYVVQYVGEWKPNPNGYGDPILTPSYVKEYTSLNDIEMFYCHYFNIMIKTNQVVLNSGPYVFQIQK